jgi:hypothetical protein
VLCFTVIIMLSQNYNISLRGIRKSARKRACALGRAWSWFRYKYIDHNLRRENECFILRSPRKIAYTVIFPPPSRAWDTSYITYYW